MRLICPYCHFIIARIEEETVIEGSAKCPKCKGTLGFTNTTKRGLETYR